MSLHYTKSRKSVDGRQSPQKLSLSLNLQLFVSVHDHPSLHVWSLFLLQG